MAKHLIPGDRTLQAIKPGDPRKRINDGDGLYLLLFVKGGSHGWRFDYSFAGKRRTISLGTYPDTGLSLAREKAEAERKRVAACIDPSAARQEKKAALVRQAEATALADAGLPGPGTFEHVAREWLVTVHEAKVTEGHAERTRIRFEQDVFPWLGTRPIAEIEAPDLLQVLRRVEARQAIETAHRIKYSCGQVFAFGIASGYCKRNPANDLRDALRPVPTRHHAAIVDPKQSGDLLRDMVGYRGHPVTRAALALSALLLLRPGELRQMEWSWLDLEAATLTVPGEVMKRKKAEKLAGGPHVVPLARQAVSIFSDLMPLTGGEGRRFVFPALHTSLRCMSDGTVNMALRRMGYDRNTMTAHGFRAMARTMIVERLNIAPDLAEAQLAHRPADPLGRAYNRAEFLDQRRDMMQRWADYLDRLRDGAQIVKLPLQQWVK